MDGSLQVHKDRETGQNNKILHQGAGGRMGQAGVEQLQKSVLHHPCLDLSIGYLKPPQELDYFSD
jgi:hypothetical protein